MHLATTSSSTYIQLYFGLIIQLLQDFLPICLKKKKRIVVIISQALGFFFFLVIVNKINYVMHLTFHILFFLSPAPLPQSFPCIDHTHPVWLAIQNVPCYHYFYVCHRQWKIYFWQLHTSSGKGSVDCGLSLEKLLAIKVFTNVRNCLVHSSKQVHLLLIIS